VIGRTEKHDNDIVSLQKMYIFIQRHSITRTPAIAKGSRVRRCKRVAIRPVYWTVYSFFRCRSFSLHSFCRIIFV